MHNTIDEKTLKKIFEGDKRVLDEVYEAYFPEISRFIRFRVDTQELADDLTGNVFIKTFEYIHRQNPIENVRAFLYRVAKNEIAMFYRDRKLELELKEDEGDRSLSEESINRFIDFTIEWGRAKSVLNQLRGDWREIIYLRFLEERSYEEISDVVGKSEGAVRVILHRALQELRKLIENI